METILIFGAGALVGGLLAAKIIAQPTAPVSPAPPARATGSRWTSEYHGPAFGAYPGAGMAEKLYSYGEYHKMTGYTPYATTAGITGATVNGSIIYID